MARAGEQKTTVAKNGAQVGEEEGGRALVTMETIREAEAASTTTPEAIIPT